MEKKDIIDVLKELRSVIESYSWDMDDHFKMSYQFDGIDLFEFLKVAVDRIKNDWIDMTL